MTTKSLRQVDAAWRWWSNLRPSEKSPGDRAALARLRRCVSPMEAAAESATSDLFHALGFHSPEKNLERVAVLAIVLSGVRENNRGKIARALGPSKDKADDAILTPLRLRRFLAARGAGETLVAFRRVVRMLGGVADVNDLAELVLAWNEDGAGDRARVRFAFDYHNAGDYAPPARASQPIQEETIQ